MFRRVVAERHEHLDECNAVGDGVVKQWDQHRTTVVVLDHEDLPWRSVVFERGARQVPENGRQIGRTPRRVQRVDVGGQVEATVFTPPQPTRATGIETMAEPGMFEKPIVQHRPHFFDRDRSAQLEHSEDRHRRPGILHPDPGTVGRGQSLSGGISHTRRVGVEGANAATLGPAPGHRT
jgi:hypothetical protein